MYHFVFSYKNNMSCNKSKAPVNTVRIGAYVQEPYVYPCFRQYPDSHCSNVGTDLEYIYHIIFNVLHLQVEWKLYTNEKEAFTALDSDQIDLIGNTIVPGLKSNSNESSYETPPHLYWGPGFFVKSVSVAKPLNPFIYLNWDTWFCIISTNILLFVFNKCVFKFRYRFAFVLSKIVTLLWCVVLLFVMEFYGNILTSDLITFDKLTPTFTDLNDLGNKLISNECHLVIFNQYMNDSDVLAIYNPTQNKSWSEKFRTAFRVNHPIQVDTKTDMFAFVENSTCAVGLDYINPDINLYDFLCDISVKIFPDELAFHPFVFYHKLKELDQTMDSIFASDPLMELATFLVKRYSKLDLKQFSTSCLIRDESEFDIPLRKLSYCFAILIVGLLLSGFFLIFQSVRKFMCM